VSFFRRLAHIAVTIPYPSVHQFRDFFDFRFGHHGFFADKRRGFQPEGIVNNRHLWRRLRTATYGNNVIPTPELIYLERLAFVPESEEESEEEEDLLRLDDDVPVLDPELLRLLVEVDEEFVDEDLEVLLLEVLLPDVLFSGAD
jgi:hypothetical protein